MADDVEDASESDLDEMVAAQDGAEPDYVFENKGYCPCCRSQTVFRAYQDWLRDYYVCTNCGSVPRQRHIQHVLDTRFRGWEDLAIHESSPSHDFLARFANDYSCSQLLADVAPGEVRDGVRNENIEALTFADESIDIFVTQDVMEHVFNPGRAVQEILRVLRPGGAYVFTAPKHNDLVHTVQRASSSPGGDVAYLLEPEYHGNPVGDGRALVTFDYGSDFEALMSGWVHGSVETIHTVDRGMGLDGDFNEVFIIWKEPFPVLAAVVQKESDEVSRRHESQMAELTTQIVELTTQLRNVQQALDDVKSSTSWQVTSPLRKVSGRIKHR